MDNALDHYQGEAAKVLDVGSLNVNGTYRSLIEDRGWEYIGLDIVPGGNVDIVSDNPLHYPFPDESFDIIISGSTMEHVTAIWEWVPELARLLRSGGLLVILTVTSWKEHKFPIDCWRILPDGMSYLFDLTGTLQDYNIFASGGNDIVGSAYKSGSAYKN